ncbi:GlxA family transcriptional regulator [Rhodoferax sp.]|uniref:GlxA family transcriptional regulator n=1 Tax=Rhodoferax sp. TaxID=50421 RepID=UPI0025DCBB9E|nr:GlxA family transcriptional regulator [Rhodoferax sp.]
MRKVALVIHEGVQALDVAGPLDVFAEANSFVPEGEGYECVIIAEHTRAMRASNGTLLLADLSYAEVQEPFHTTFVAGGPGLPTKPAHGPTRTWLRRWGPPSERFGSICTGAFLLGHAGLLDDRTVTTHWQSAGELANLFPAARVEYDRIYARDGNLFTSAGVTAGIDLALALVREDFGGTMSLACAKRLVVVAQRQGGQSQFSPLLILSGDPASPLGKVQAYVMAHLSEPYSVERIASLAGTSVRSVARLFTTELDMTPHEFVEGVRIDKARNLLEATALPVKVIAYECGFTSPEHMRVAFQRRLNLSPIRYRENFSAGGSFLG